MHMSDVLIVPAVGAAMFACSGIAAHRSIHHLNKETDTSVIPMMGVLGAFVFAAQMINFSIPGTGSSGHICGSLLLTAVLGPYAAFLTMIGILTVQALLFADGGILALGCNIWNMAFYGCFIGGLVFWQPMMKKTVSKKRILAVSIFASIVTLQLGAFSVVIQTTLSGITELPFVRFVTLMQPIHLVIGLIEGVLTGLVLMYVYEARPERLWSAGTVHTAAQAGKKRAGLALVFLTAALVLGAVLSLAASSNPDGLEWAIGKTAAAEHADAAIEGAASSIHTFFETVQQKTSVLPDYAFKNSDSSAGTVFSGIAGVLLLTLAGLGAGTLIKRKYRS